MAQSKSLRNVFSYQSWVHAVSGATGSVIAMSVFFPLDTVRSRLQLEENDKRKAQNTLQILKQLIHDEGIKSLYRGLVPVLQSVCISNFVYFYTFHSLKALGGKASQSALKDLLLGSIAGVVCVLSTTPFWVVNTRLKMKGVEGQLTSENQNYNNLIQGLCYIWKSEGRNGLWAGTIPSLMLVINPALHFMMYELIKRRMTKLYGEISGASFFLIGALSKAFATLLTYPLQLVQAKQRHDAKEKNIKQSLGTFQMLLNIIKSQGLAGVFRGLEAKIIQTVLTAALMFSIYEKVAKFVKMILTKQTRVII